MLPGVEELLALARGAPRRRVGAVGRRRRRLRAHRRDAAAAGAARGGRRATSSGCSPRTGGPCAGCWRACPAAGGGAAAALGPHRPTPSTCSPSELAGLRAMLADHPARDPARPHPRAGGRRRDPPHAHRAGAARAARRRPRREPARAARPPPDRCAGAAARWLRERAQPSRRPCSAELDAGWAGCRCGPSSTRAAEPTGVAALLELAADLWRRRRPGGRSRRPPRPPPLRACGAPRATAVRWTRRSSWRSPCPAPPPAPWTWPGSGDELAVAVGGVRRLVALPSVLRRCTVTAAPGWTATTCASRSPDPARWSAESGRR